MNKAITWRKATKADLPIAKEMVRDYIKLERREYDPTMYVHWANSRSASRYLASRLKKKDHLFIVALARHRIVGFLIGTVMRRSAVRRQAKSSRLVFLYVRPRYRSKGIGTQLGRVFNQWCRRRGISRMSIKVSAKNRRAVHLYRRMGYKEYEIILEKKLT
ncbi:MAG: GNAT family N-acetyltransferase [Patescibacteria group bacterium]